VYTKFVNVYYRPENVHMQMVFSHDNTITVSNGQQLPATSARQSSMKLIHPNIA